MTRNYYNPTITTKADVRGCPSFVVDLAWALVAIPAAVDVPDTAISDTADTFTKAGHGLKTGMCVRVSTDGLALPSPLAAGTDYWVIRIDNDVVKLALTYADATAATAVPIDLTDTGSAAATVTLTPQTNAGTVVIERAINPTNKTSSLTWKTLQTYNLVTDTSPKTYAVTDNPYSWIRVTWSVTKGALSTNTAVLGGQAWAK